MEVIFIDMKNKLGKVFSNSKLMKKNTFIDSVFYDNLKLQKSFQSLDRADYKISKKQSKDSNRNIINLVKRG